MILGLSVAFRSAALVVRLTAAMVLRIETQIGGEVITPSSQ